MSLLETAALSDRLRLSDYGANGTIVKSLRCQTSLDREENKRNFTFTGKTASEIIIEITFAYSLTAKRSDNEVV